MNNEIINSIGALLNLLADDNFNEYESVAEHIGVLILEAPKGIAVNELITRIGEEVGVQYMQIIITMVSIASGIPIPEPDPEILLMHSMFKYLRDTTSTEEAMH